MKESLEQVSYTNVQEVAGNLVDGAVLYAPVQVEQSQVETNVNAELVVDLCTGGKSPVNVERIADFTEQVALVEQGVGGSTGIPDLMSQSKLEGGAGLSEHLDMFINLIGIAGLEGNVEGQFPHPDIAQMGIRSSASTISRETRLPNW